MTDTLILEPSVENLTRDLTRLGDDRYPRLVLSIIGDSSSFVPKPWLTPVFQLGLTETAKGAKDCLVIYKGSTEKVSNLVWEAIDDFCVLKEGADEKSNITLVGLRPNERNVQDRVNVENAESQRSELVEEKYYKLNFQSSDEYKIFHADLLESIAKEYVPFVELGNDLKIKIPVLVIVAEGDLSTLDQVVKVLKRGIPVLVLKGSGKAADLIAECIDNIDSIEIRAPLLFGIYFQMDDFKRVKNYIKEIEKNKHFVNIFDLDQQDETEFSNVVVTSIIRAWSQGRKNNDERPVKSAIPMSRNRRFAKDTPNEENYENLDQELYHDSEYGTSPILVKSNGFAGPKRKFPNNSVKPVSTVTCNNMNVTGEVKEFMQRYQTSLTPASLPLYFYIAYQFIQEMPVDDNDFKTGNFEILLKQAIIANRVDYVKVLLQEENVEFDRQQFPYIYFQTIECSCTTDGDCQHIWSILMGSSTDATYKLLKDRKKITLRKNNEQVVKNYQKCIQSGRQLCQKFLHYPRRFYSKKELRVDKDNAETQRKEIYQDLLIWALFANRQELATIFWVKCNNQLLTAIFASCVLKRMAEKAKSGKDQFLHDSIKGHSRIFENRAIDLQRKLYEEEPQVAMDLILTEQTVWNIKVSPLECAFDNAMLDFIAYSCAQRRLNKIWYREIGANLEDFWLNGFFCYCQYYRRVKTSNIRFFRFVSAPLTRFLINYIFFIAAMVCYSAFLLTQLSVYENIGSVGVYEWLVYIWLLGDILEEYRGILPWNNEVIKSRFAKEEEKDKPLSLSIKYRIKRYFYDFWNSLDFISYWITIAAMIVRFFDDDDTNGALARRFYSLSLFTVYMRFLHSILMSRKLGPKIIMIKEMLKDLFRFIGILFVFMMGVGVLYHANMYPAHYDMWNPTHWTYWRIWKIMYIPYWQIYGELFLEDFKENSNAPSCTTIRSVWESDPSMERCIEYDWVLIVIAALYMLISNLLLVNLVIALFSYRFEIVQANSERLWRYWRYSVIMDYRTRVPAPLNLIIRPFMMIAKCIKRCKKSCDKDKDLEKVAQEREIKRMERLQDICANKCIRAIKI
ncbi:transient receptor potential cation channel subfamily M member 2-like isoform X1 [Mytilus galloprovincialis]|uniref:transient receptor potential cation channel subfamily M member 2-like isoform X1 n=1 Tax=Mytilus galloprovincialis TaxID=29158 RepID=UPI003F7BBE81